MLSLRGSFFFVSLAGAWIPVIAGGQSREREPIDVTSLRLDDFRLSGPPALSLLGSSASAVARPNTPRDLIASLVSGAGSEGIVPDGFALETSPWWLVRHRSITLEQYHNAPLGRRVLHFTSISVATSRTRDRTESDGYDSNAAVAIRTLLANGRPSAALRAAADEMRKEQIAYIEAYRLWEAASPLATRLNARRRQLAQQENLLSSLVTRVLVAPAPSLRDSTLRTLARRDSLRALVALGEPAAADTAELNARMERIETRLAGLAERFSSEELEPDGFILEVAGGLRARFPDGRWADERLDGIGAWITPMYRIASRGIEVIGVARYLTNVAGYDDRSLTDLGVRAGFEIGKGSLSAEHVWRRLSGEDLDTESDSSRRTTRWAALFDYPLGGKLWIVAGFGSDYRSAGDRPVIATIGLNLGIGAIELLPGR